MHEITTNFKFAGERQGIYGRFWREVREGRKFLVKLQNQK